MDNKDFVFINKEQSEKDDKEFSDFLKNLKIGNNIKKRKEENIK